MIKRDIVYDRPEHNIYSVSNCGLVVVVSTFFWFVLLLIALIKLMGDLMVQEGRSVNVFISFHFPSPH